MKPKFKKYEGGGWVGGAIEGVAGAVQTGYGVYEASQAKNEIKKLRENAPSLATPSEYYEAIKNAYDMRLLQMQYQAIDANLASTVQALSMAGGRALAAGANKSVNQAARQREMLALKQNDKQNKALSDLARAQERTLSREDRRWETYLDQEYSNLQGANQQIAAGVSSMAEGAFYASQRKQTKDVGNQVVEEGKSQKSDNKASVNAEYIAEQFKSGNLGGVADREQSLREIDERRRMGAITEAEAKALTDAIKTFR